MGDRPDLPDDRFLDLAFDIALDRWADDPQVRLDDLIAERPHLASELEEVRRLTRLIAATYTMDLGAQSTAGRATSND